MSQFAIPLLFLPAEFIHFLFQELIYLLMTSFLQDGEQGVVSALRSEDVVANDTLAVAGRHFRINLK
jgi:hypothetical protein